MIWLTSFSFVVILFTYQHGLVESRKHSSNSSKSPWANPAKANNFMKCLIQEIGSSPAFPQQEKEDMESIVETMMAAMSGMSSSKGSSGATLQAMNMAFASSMAELVIAEDVDDAEGIAVKTKALAQVLKQCFRSTMGSVNRHFITEIKDLIGMFAREAAETGDNDMDDEGEDVEQFDGDSSFSVGVGTDDFGVVAGDYPSLEATNQVSGPTTGDVSSQFSQNLASTFTNLDILKAVFNSRISPNVVRNVIGSAIEDLSNGLNFDFSTSSELKNDVIRALASVMPGSDIHAYIQAIVPAISRVLAGKGILNQSTKNQVKSQITMGMIKGIASAAPRNGINVANINLQNDLQRAENPNYQQGQLTATYDTRDKTTGFDSSLSYPGGLDTSSAYPRGLDTIGAYPGSLDTTGTKTGLDAGVGMQLDGASGSSGAGISSKLATTLGNALLQSTTFRGVFKRGVSSSDAGSLLNIALQQISADLGFDASTSGQLRNAILQAVEGVPQGSDSNAYAQSIAPAFARVLVSSNKLNDRNAKLLGSKIATGLVKSLSVNAPRFGIRPPGINLDNDLQRINSIMAPIEIPQPLVSLGGDNSTGSYQSGLDTAGAYPRGLDASGANAGVDAGVGMHLGGDSGSSGANISSKLAITLGNALLQSTTFRVVFKREVSSSAAGALLNIALQQISADLGLDASTSFQLRNAILQAVAAVPQGSDSNAYAQAIAPAFARVLLSTNKLNDRNAKPLGIKIATGLVKSLSVNAFRFGIRPPGVNVDNDLQKDNNIMAPMEIPQPLVSLGGDVGTGSSPVGLDTAGANRGGLDATSGYTGGSDTTGNNGGVDAGVGMQIGGASGSSGASLSSKLATALGNSLLQSTTFRGVFKRGVSSSTAGGLLNIALQQISADLGLDASTSGQLKNVILQAIAAIPQGSDSNAYAQTIAPAFAGVLVSTSKLNNRNAKPLGIKIATGLVKSLSVNAPRFAIRLPGINFDNDFQKVNTIMDSMGIPQPSVSLGNDDSTGSYPSRLDAAGAYPGGLDATSAYTRGLGTTGTNAGVDAEFGMQLGGASGSSGTSLSSKLSTTLGNALLQSATFRGVFKRGVSSVTARSLFNIALQQISTDLGLDASTSSQLRNVILQVVAAVPQSSDSNAYAQAIAPAFARVLVLTNKLNDRNAIPLGIRIATGLVKSLSVNARRFGIRLPGINLDNDHQKVNSLMVPMDIPQSSVSLGSADGTGSYPSGLDTAGAYPGGLDTTGANAGVDTGVGMQLGGTSGSYGASLFSKLSTTLGNALLQSATFRGAFKRGISSSTAGALLNIALQQISADLALDVSTSGQLRNVILQAIAAIPQGSDSNAYAQAIASSFARVLVSTNKLNYRNAKLLGIKIATGLVKSLSVNARRFGIRLPGINVDNDLQNVNTIMDPMDIPQPLVSLGGDDSTGSYPSGLDATDAYTGGLGLTGPYAGGDAGVGMQTGGALGSSAPVLSDRVAGVSLGCILDSPNGLKSPQANSRISGLDSSLTRTVSPKRYDVNTFARGLKGTLSQPSNSGMSLDQAKVEGLMEALVALVQILNSSQIGQVNNAAMSSTSNSMARVQSSI